MTDIAVPLTERELATLLICCEGGAVAAIGHWKDEIEGLEKRGFLEKLDQFNFVITAAGRKAAESAEDENIRAFFKIAATIPPAIAGVVGDSSPESLE